MNKNLSDDILCRFPVIRKKVLLDPMMPETLRRKAAVLTLEDFFIKDSLTRVNKHLSEFSKHGIVVSSRNNKRVEFYWFGKSHGMEIRTSEKTLEVPSIAWRKHGRLHGPKSEHVGFFDQERTIPRFKTSFFESGTKFSEKETSEPLYKGCTSLLTKEAAKTVFRYSRDQLKLNLR